MYYCNVSPETQRYDFTQQVGKEEKNQFTLNMSRK